METVTKYEIRPTTPEELESTLYELGENVELTFDTREAQQRFNELIRSLQEKRVQMHETIRTLEKTKNVLRGEMKKRSAEEEKLGHIVSELIEEKSAIEQSVQEVKEKYEKIDAEKERISVLMGSLKTAIEQMQTKLAEL